MKSLQIQIVNQHEKKIKIKCIFNFFLNTIKRGQQKKIKKLNYAHCV